MCIHTLHTYLWWRGRVWRSVVSCKCKAGLLNSPGCASDPGHRCWSLHSFLPRHSLAFLQHKHKHTWDNNTTSRIEMQMSSYISSVPNKIRSTKNSKESRSQDNAEKSLKVKYFFQMQEKYIVSWSLLVYCLVIGHYQRSNNDLLTVQYPTYYMALYIINKFTTV